MTGQDAFETELRSWFDSDADRAIPAETRGRVFDTFGRRRPRPSSLSAFGSHWVVDRQAGRATSMWHDKLGSGLARAFLALLLTLALVGAVLLAGSNLRQVEPALGQLVYQRDGDIFLADADGSDPRRVSPDPPADGGVRPRYDLTGPGSAWASDGRHFVFDQSFPRRVAYIADADGRIVGTIAGGFEGRLTWSPDASHLYAWTDGGIGMFAIDGSIETILSLPDGAAVREDTYLSSRKEVGLWVPDARSVWVWIQQPVTYPCDVPVSPARSYPEDCAGPEAWALQVDGSAPRRVGGDLRWVNLDPTFSPDGTRMAYSGVGSPWLDRSLADWAVQTANLDGTDRRTSIRVDQDPYMGRGVHPIWSPRGDQIAYLWGVGGAVPWDTAYWPHVVDLRVVDLDTGITRSIRELDKDAQDVRWSPAGGSLLYHAADDQGVMSLWSISSNGGAPTLLVRGASDGEWQPTQVSEQTP